MHACARGRDPGHAGVYQWEGLDGSHSGSAVRIAKAGLGLPVAACLHMWIGSERTHCPLPAIGGETPWPGRACVRNHHAWMIMHFPWVCNTLVVRRSVTCHSALRYYAQCACRTCACSYPTQPPTAATPAMQSCAFQLKRVGSPATAGRLEHAPSKREWLHATHFRHRTACGGRTGRSNRREAVLRAPLVSVHTRQPRDPCYAPEQHHAEHARQPAPLSRGWRCKTDQWIQALCASSSPSLYTSCDRALQADGGRGEHNVITVMSMGTRPSARRKRRRRVDCPCSGRAQQLLSQTAGGFHSGLHMHNWRSKLG